jgi:hypothetical protein
MSTSIEVTLHKISEDGMPDMHELLGRVAFIWDGYIVSGWPRPQDEMDDPDESVWETADDTLGDWDFEGVEYWMEFPVALWDLAPEDARVVG